MTEFSTTIQMEKPADMSVTTTNDSSTSAINQQRKEQPNRNESSPTSTSEGGGIIDPGMRDIVSKEIEMEVAAPATTVPAISIEEDSPLSQQQGSTVTTGEKTSKKRKYNEACSECRRVHKACSGKRPCDRCVKMGIADKCQSMERKKRRMASKRWYNYHMNQEEDGKIIFHNSFTRQQQHQGEEENNDGTTLVSSPNNNTSSSSAGTSNSESLVHSRSPEQKTIERSDTPQAPSSSALLQQEQEQQEPLKENPSAIVMTTVTTPASPPPSYFDVIRSGLESTTATSTEVVPTTSLTYPNEDYDRHGYLNYHQQHTPYRLLGHDHRPAPPNYVTAVTRHSGKISAPVNESAMSLPVHHQHTHEPRSTMYSNHMTSLSSPPLRPSMPHNRSTYHYQEQQQQYSSHTYPYNSVPSTQQEQQHHYCYHHHSSNSCNSSLQHYPHYYQRRHPYAPPVHYLQHEATVVGGPSAAPRQQPREASSSAPCICHQYTPCQPPRTKDRSAADNIQSTPAYSISAAPVNHNYHSHTSFNARPLPSLNHMITSQSQATTSSHACGCGCTPDYSSHNSYHTYKR